MNRMKLVGSTVLATLALGALMLSPAAAQAKPAVVHKGASVYQWCTAANGCWTAMFVYSKTKEFEAPETSIFGGAITKKRVEKKSFTVFTSDDESGAQCIMTARKTSTGYGTESEPGTIVCREGTAPPYIEEAWWAVRV